MRFTKGTFLLVLIVLSCVTKLCAFESHKLANGLEVFIEENHIVPLVNIRRNSVREVHLQGTPP